MTMFIFLAVVFWIIGIIIDIRILVTTTIAPTSSMGQFAILILRELIALVLAILLWTTFILSRARKTTHSPNSQSNSKSDDLELR